MVKFKLSVMLKCQGKNCLLKPTLKEEDLYHCFRHNKTFCYSCLVPSRAYKFYNAAHCKDKILLGDFFNMRYINPIDDNCIYEKVSINDAEFTEKSQHKLQGEGVLLSS